VNRTVNSQNKKISKTIRLQSRNKDLKNEANDYLNKGFKWLDIDQTKAKVFFEKACKNSKKYDNEVVAKASFELAQIHLDERNVKQARKALQEALKCATSSSTDMSRLISEINYSLAFIMLSKKKDLSAQTYLENFLESENALENLNNVKLAKAKLELGKLFLQEKNHQVEKILNEALNILNKDGLLEVTCKAECYQLLGEFYVSKGNYEKVLQNNLECLKILKEHKSEIDNLDDLKLKLANSFANAGIQLAKQPSVQTEEKALSFLRNSLELYNEVNEEQRNESSWMLAKILVNALNVLSRKSDKQECNKILESLENENFQKKDFLSLEDYNQYVLDLTNSLINLKMFEDGYQILEKNLKHFEGAQSDTITLANFYYNYSTLSYESNRYEEALSKNDKLTNLLNKQKSISQEMTDKLFLASTCSIKCQIKLSKKENLSSNEFEDWSKLSLLVEDNIFMDSVRDIFLSLTENEQFSLCERFLLKVLSLKGDKNFKEHKLIYTYLAILHSKKNDFSKTIIYSDMAKTSNFTKIFDYFSKPSETLLSKVIKNSTLMNECYKTLIILQTKKSANENVLTTLSSLWDLCHRYIEKSDTQTSLILLEEINQILQTHISSSYDFQGNIQILKILIGIEMGELESAVSLLKEVTEGDEVSCSNDFIPLIYFLYGDVLKDLNSSEEAMLMWMKAVNTHLKMRTKTNESQRFTKKNASLFENLMSDRIDFLPDLYRRTVEQHFR